ncbi:HpcH/HpaI aldolase/citrate lyase family protein [Azospirillum canadense]|uniref:HpcH/HpaI aldolase/citrate lyase family protein n=1 Tax=Azospirillum canadense TaxID=403962 RepID=UPI002226CBF3|nr:CoA ester lyase [Azospirillum canadense]MCW2238814.1 malyl-CoA/(S)-citramalyl-CoA lyase [Azospirillum canadense]
MSGHERMRRLQRSELAVPATSERFFAKAAAGPADVVFLDLEDAVAPTAKEQARENAVRALAEIDWGPKTMALRVNGLDTPWALKDIVEVVSRAPRLDLVLLPKAGSAFDVRFVEQILTLIEREQGREKQVGIEVLIETARGVANAEEIAASSDRLEAMIFGIGDYTVDMRTYDPVFGTPSERYAVLTGPDAGGRRERHWNDQWHFAMARVANACRANGLRPIDGPFTDFGDAEGYRASALRAAALGFEGKWAIHPTQVALANEVFSPSEQQIAWARAVHEAMGRATAEGRGAVGVDGVLVDMAHLKQADALLRRAEEVAVRDGRQA